MDIDDGSFIYGMHATTVDAPKFLAMVVTHHQLIFVKQTVIIILKTIYLVLME